MTLRGMRLAKMMQDRRLAMREKAIPSSARLLWEVE